MQSNASSTRQQGADPLAHVRCRRDVVAELERLTIKQKRNGEGVWWGDLLLALPQWPRAAIEEALERLNLEDRCYVQYLHVGANHRDPEPWKLRIGMVKWAGNMPPAVYIGDLEAVLRQEADDVGADDALEALTRACLDDPKLGERVMAHLADLVANEDSATENDEGVAR
jgi:hypothetical protein